MTERRREVRESIVRYLARSLRSSFKEVWSYNLGKVSVLIIGFMVLASIYSLLSLPPDFPQMWKATDRPPWTLNPKQGYPVWVKYLGVPVAETVSYEKVRLQEARIVVPRDPRDCPPRDLDRVLPEFNKSLGLKPSCPLGYTEVYRVSYTLAGEVFPQDVVIVLKAMASEKVNLTSVSVIPMVFTTRPDGVTLYTFEGKYTLERLVAGIEIKMRCDLFAPRYIEYYRLNTTVDSLCTLLNRPIFGEPLDVRASGFKPITGEYQVTLALLYTGVEPRDIERLIRNGDVSVSPSIRVIGNSYGLLGTDTKGRDLFQGLLYGFPVALIIGLSVAFAVVAIGLVLGVISGYFGGRVDEVIQRLVDVIVNIPLLPLLVLVGVAIQTGGWTGWPALTIIMAVLVAFSWGGVTIIVRSMTLSIKAEPYIEAAKALGASTWRIVFRHIIPQIVPYATAVLVFSVPGAIIAEAGLSVLGIDHGLPTWGRILADAQAERGVAYAMWWWVLPPGLMLGLFSFAFVALGFTLETIVEPRLRRR